MLWIALVAAVVSCNATPTLADETIEQLIEHVSVSYETPKQITWYKPRIDDATHESTAFATLGVRNDGTRIMVLNLFQPMADVLLVKQLHLMIDDQSREIMSLFTI